MALLFIAKKIAIAIFLTMHSNEIRVPVIFRANPEEHALPFVPRGLVEYAIA